MSKRAVVFNGLWLLLFLLIFGYTLSVRHPGLRPNTEEFDVAIKGSKMTPSEIAIEEGDTAFIKVTTDHPIELRILGIGFEADVEPQASHYDAGWSIEAEDAGRFGIEDGRTGTRLGTLVVEPD
jgi:hypothetical protein